MPKACELKRGSLVAIQGTPHLVEELQVQTPSARGGASLYKVRFRNLVTKQKLDQTFKGDDALPGMDVEHREVQFSYMQGDDYVFMDTEDYREIVFLADDLGDEKNYITEDLEGFLVLMSGERPLALRLPQTVVLEIVECSPSMKGSSATARTKPATLATGLVVQVPEYLAPHETIKVDTRTGKYLGRA